MNPAKKMKRKSKVIAAIVVIAIAGVAGFALYHPEESAIPEKGGAVIVRGASDDFLVIRSETHTNYIAKDKIELIKVNLGEPYWSSVIIYQGKENGVGYSFKSREDAGEFAERLQREVER